jgi:IS5 family transposase
LFGEQLPQLGLGKLLFDRFYSELENYGVTIKGGIAMDGTFINVPKQHFHQDEYAQIKKGEKPESRTSKPAVQSQTDFDARYTRKNSNEKHDGYKNHVEADVDTKMITDYDLTSASVHDRVPFLDLLPKEAEKDEQNKDYKQPIFADSAYKSQEVDEELKRRGFDPLIIERAYRNHPLIDEQKASNKLKSKIRCRIEHIFGVQKMRMGNEILRTIGIIRAKFQIGMRNLVYNRSRLVSLKRMKKIK